jgi:tetratricopeptide (TPR) repeat protein
MDDLVDALERRRRVDPLAIGGLAAAAAVGVIAIFVVRTATAEPCDAAGAELAQWNDARREAVSEALLATSVPYAVETTHTVVQALDAHAEALADARWRACAATHVDATQSEAALDLRVACLDRGANELGAMVAVLEQADRDVVENAVRAVRSLRPASTCDDVQRLEDDVLVPDDPAARVAVETLRREVEAAAVLIKAGKYQAALDDLDRVVPQAVALDHAALRGVVELHRGAALHHLSELERAQEAQLAAAEAATAAGDDRTAARAFADAAFNIGHSQGRIDEGRGHLRTAESLVERLGSPSDLRAHVLTVSGVIAHDAGEFDIALRDLESALALERADEGHPSPAVLTDLGRVLHSLGRTAEAEAMLAEAIAVAERDMGEAHPQVGKVLAYVGMVHVESGRNEEALAAHERELAIFTAALPDDHMLVAFGLANVAGIETYLQRHEAARPKFERARTIVQQRLGAEHPNVGRITMNIAESWRIAGDLDRSLEEYESALATLVAALGAEHPDTARCRTNLASVLYSRGRYEDAGREYGAALDSLVVSLGADHPGLAYPLTGIGQSLIERGAAEDAIEPLERALALRTGDPTIDPFDLGDTKLALARALWDSNRDRTRALELGRGARQAYIDAGPERAEARKYAEDWLAEHGDAPAGPA